MVLVAILCVGLAGTAAYFDTAQIKGDVGFYACWCGLSPATVADGKVVLAESNHDTPAGTVIATLRVDGESCTVTQIEEDGQAGETYELVVDHLGAQYTEDGQTIYMILVDNWKLYPFCFFRWIERRGN